MFHNYQKSSTLKLKLQLGAEGIYLQAFLVVVSESVTRSLYLILQYIRRFTYKSILIIAIAFIND